MKEVLKAEIQCMVAFDLIRKHQMEWSKFKHIEDLLHQTNEHIL